MRTGADAYSPSDRASRAASVDRSNRSRYAPRPAMTTEELLAELRSSPTDLARVVEAVSSSGLPYVLIPIAALKGWQERDPDAWRKVEAWLIARGKNVVEV
jgi:predicted PhzF superfamily epimerase YddE/YHI9